MAPRFNQNSSSQFCVQEFIFLVIMLFICPCGYKEDLEPQQNVVAHMKQCKEFQSASPLCKLVHTYPLHNLTVQQLLTFRADLQVQMEFVDRILEQSNINS
jgi:hypothetical protein